MYDTMIHVCVLTWWWCLVCDCSGEPLLCGLSNIGIGPWGLLLLWLLLLALSAAALDEGLLLLVLVWGFFFCPESILASESDWENSIASSKGLLTTGVSFWWYGSCLDSWLLRSGIEAFDWDKSRASSYFWFFKLSNFEGF